MPVVSNHGEINNVSEISKELKELSAAELLWHSRRYLIFNIYIYFGGQGGYVESTWSSSTFGGGYIILSSTSQLTGNY